MAELYYVNPALEQSETARVLVSRSAPLMTRQSQNPPADKNDPKKKDSDRVDRDSEATFPASDPPSYAGGNHIIGEPPRPEKNSPKKA
jgi:hypothetical protein